MSTDTDLLAAIADGAPGAHEVYADWLVERGDPRGELIHVQLARESAPDDRALETRERELFAAHLKTWLPDAHWLVRPPEVNRQAERRDSKLRPLRRRRRVGTRMSCRYSDDADDL